MSWNKCKAFGVIDILEPNGDLRLYYGRHDSMYVTKPSNDLLVESATWQGENIVIRGTNGHGDRVVYTMSGPNEYQRIF